ncbi:sugar phosphate isomerase/epimerase family protein [Calidithermus timidus]|jgi:sugar phosphate isomerase/epimerase|uniref:sugar phosphate isomerase/epimerase family protein n=1 Tax=Calidithermus timidus TaxID=307124 RepID=UPI00036AE773|nr:sugar phosphate isomerase/epimerase family protein [Calidithermus timidus]
MKLGFSTATTGLDYPQAFELAARLGLFLEIPYDLHEMDPRLPSARQLLEMGRAAGVGFTVHLPFVDLNLASLIPDVGKLSLERVQRSLEFAQTLGAHCGVLHTGKVAVRQPLALETARRYLDTALRALTPLPIPVALENLALSPSDLLQGPDELAEVLEAHPEYGFCLDVGHALVEGKEGQAEVYHQRFDGRLIHWHLHDNLGDRDSHLPVGLGRVNWSWVKEKLRDFKGTIALEVTGGQGGIEQSVHLLRSR